MSTQQRRQAIARVEGLVADHVNRRADALRTTIYDTLERNRIGDGIFHPGNRVPSSRQGQPPARQTGKLQESIAVVTEATPAVPAAFVGPDPAEFTDEGDYPAYLEFGTRRIKPRPYIAPSVAELRIRVG